MLNRFLGMTALAAAQLFAPMAHSQAIEEIRVTADPLSGVDGHMIRPTDVLNKEQLKSRNLQNIGETVSGELGVSSSDFGAGAGRPVIRGLAGGRVKVMENGVSTMDVSTISNDHAVSTEPVFAEQVEILRGPATLLYGSGASGGLVNVVSNRIPKAVPESPEGNALAQYESVNNGFTGAADLTAGGSNLALYLGGMYRDTSDYSIPGFAEAQPDEGEEPGKVENSAVESDNVSAGVSYIDELVSFGTSISGTNSQYGIPGHHHHEETAPVVEEVGGVTVDMEQVRYDFNGSLKSTLPAIKELRTRWGYNDYEHSEVEPDGAIGTTFTNEELEGRVEAIHNPLAKVWDGVIGIQLNNRDFAAIGEEAFVPASEQDTLAAFLVEKADFDRWHVDLGMRYEDQQSESMTGGGADHGLISFSGGANFDVATDHEIGFSLGRFQRGPTIEELFAEGPHLATNAFEVGNIDLRDETSTNLDLHWHKVDGKQTFRINLFYNLIDDFIYLQEQDLNNDGAADRVAEDFSGDVAEILDADETEEPLLLFHSQADARFYGIEAETIFGLGEVDGAMLNLRLWGDYVEGELKNGGALPRITPWRLGSGLEYENEGWSFNLDYTFTGKQNDTAPLEEPTPGYHMLNAYAGYSFDMAPTTLTVFIRGTNLLDDEARRHTSFVKNIAPLPGRSGLIGVRATF